MPPNDGNCCLTTSVVKVCRVRDPPPKTTKTWVVKCGKTNLLQWSMFTMNLQISLFRVILGSMVSHYRVIVGLSQSAPAVGWGSPLHAWLASVNWISGARCLNRRYHYGARGMHNHILLRLYSQNCCTYNSVVKNIYSHCHKGACVQISIRNTEWLPRYKGVS